MFRELRAHGIANGSYGIVSRGFVIIIVMRALRSNGIHPPEWIKTGLWHMYLGMFDAALFIFPQSGFFLKLFSWQCPSREAKMHLCIDLLIIISNNAKQVSMYYMYLYLY